MLIDWFTVAAQIVNFLILVFLLHRFLYRPIVRHMTEREEKIKQRLEEASNKQREAQDQIEEFRRKGDELEKEAGKKIEQAETEAGKRKEDLLEEAQKHVEEQRTKWLESLEKEKESFAREFKKRGSQEILKYVGRILNDLADEPLNNRLAGVLVNRIEKLTEQDRDKLQRASRSEEVVVRSTCELDSSEKRKLTTILHQICGKEAEVSYQADPEQPLGIEVRVGNVRLSWSIEGYLEDLKSGVMSLVEEKTHEQKKNDENKSEDKSKDKSGEDAGEMKKKDEKNKES